MASRRGTSKRPATSEEVNIWTDAATVLSKLSSQVSSPETNDVVGRVNRLLSAWPTDDTMPSEGFESLKNIYTKLNKGLNEIKANAERDAKMAEDAIERLDVLIALRRASEEQPPEKRQKRPRGSSPPPTVTPPTPVPSRPGSITLPPRNSVGPSQVPFSRDPKARREALNRQLPLREKRKVAFHPPKAGDTSSGGKDSEEWILAVVNRCINQDKNRYEVQDPEPQEDGSPGQCYNTTLRAIIPLPDPDAPPDSPSHLNAYPEFPARSTVMALYPDTSCFYRAEVITSPKDVQATGRNASTRQGPVYKLKFEDDDDQEHTVSAQWVVEWPGGT
ncbi:hypothetical protein QCA50_006677 [Cerrena zonata]|uniref:SGF29 C-terminal domain-containing protein n=1 Tax=Cerrena zonata TaxID=2478898 RepID=A0AAW0GEP7_9APHY